MHSCQRSAFQNNMPGKHTFTQETDVTCGGFQPLKYFLRCQNDIFKKYKHVVSLCHQRLRYALRYKFYIKKTVLLNGCAPNRMRYLNVSNLYL